MLIRDPSLGTAEMGNSKMLVTVTFARASAQVCVAEMAPLNVTLKVRLVLLSPAATATRRCWAGSTVPPLAGVSQVTLGEVASSTTKFMTASSDLAPSASVDCARNWRLEPGKVVAGKSNEILVREPRVNVRTTGKEPMP